MEQGVDYRHHWLRVSWKQDKIASTTGIIISSLLQGGFTMPEEELRMFVAGDLRSTQMLALKGDRCALMYFPPKGGLLPHRESSMVAWVPRQAPRVYLLQRIGDSESLSAVKLIADSLGSGIDRLSQQLGLIIISGVRLPFSRCLEFPHRLYASYTRVPGRPPEQLIGEWQEAPELKGVD